MKNFKYSINGNSYDVVVDKLTETTANVEVNGVSYQVTMDKPNETKTAQAQSPKQQEPVEEKPVNVEVSAGANVMKSPLPGIILDITCKVGDKVKIGQQVLILEAMKMENAIAADRDGVIQQILVTKGTTVLEGEDLVIIG